MCPECDSREKPWTTSRGALKCRSCGKQFSLLKGTLFERSRISLQAWFTLIREMTMGDDPVSAKHLKRKCNFGSDETAIKLARKIRKLMQEHTSAPLAGTVHVDTCSVQVNSRRNCSIRQQILIAAEYDGLRRGRVRLKPIAQFEDNLDALTLRDLVRRGSTVTTRGALEHIQLSNIGFTHKDLADESSDGELLPGCVPVAKRLQRLMRDCFRDAVSEKHLQEYLAELQFRYPERSGTTRFTEIMRLAAGTGRAQMRYRDNVG